MILKSFTRLVALLCLVGVGLGLSGCWQTSLSPWCLEHQVVAEDRLIGKWKMDGMEWIEIKYAPTSTAKHQYQLDITYCEKNCEPNTEDGEHIGLAPEQEGVVGYLKGYAFELNGELFLTTTFHEESQSVFAGRDFLQFHLMPVNVVNKVTFTADGVELAPLNFKWFSDASHKGELSVSHVRWRDLKGEDDNMVILTDSTEQLQNLLIEHSGNADLFLAKDPLELSLVAESATLEPIR